ncbi:MAG: polysaccharide deacetylase family protein [Myxococcales bacterium]|nr:polysaccharide deacetylase family protein [Myxococcales bacterium]
MAGLREQLAAAMRRTKVLSGVLRMRAALRLPVLTVLTYHHIEDPEDGSPFDPGVADATPEQFRRQMEMVARYGTALSIDEVCRIFCDGERPPPNPVLVTFDDGYRSCLEVATPILRQVGVPATFFVATRFVEERRLFWWERVSVLLASARQRRRGLVRLAVPGAAAATPVELAFDAGAPSALGTVTRLIKDTPGLELEALLSALALALGEPWTLQRDRELADRLIMTWDQVRALAAAGMDVESHTRSHRVLQTVPAAELHAELAGSRQDLERELGRPVRAIAYPVGRPLAGNPLLRAAVRDAGYTLGFTNATGTNAVLPPALRRFRSADPFDVCRLAMGRDFSDAMFLGQLALPPLAHPARHSGA